MRTTLYTRICITTSTAAPSLKWGSETVFRNLEADKFFLVEESREQMEEQHFSRPTTRPERKGRIWAIHADHQQDTHFVRE